MAQMKIFFAYESNHPDNQDAIRKAAEEYDKYQKTFHIQRWEDLSINGHVIGTKVMEAIDSCEIFACDLTYLNHNVFFELGYAIAKEKPLDIFLNGTVKNAKQNYSDMEILRNIGYTNFSNSREIVDEFRKKNNRKSVLITELIPNFDSLQETDNIFFINTKFKNQAGIELDNFFMNVGEPYITNDPAEIEYQPLRWFLTTIKQSRIVILHMLGSDKIDYQTCNAKYSLYAGIAYGLNKKLLLLAPAPFKAPIDYTDILKTYYNSSDCIEFLRYWLDEQKKQVEIPSTNNQQDAHDLNLLKLGIGVGIAEKEKDELSKCFVETVAYTKIVNSSTLIIVGRKGSGKTEIFLKMQEDIEEKRTVFTIIIKPDSIEMLENVELSDLFANPRSKKAFLQTVWKFVIFSKLFYEIYKKRTFLDINDRLKDKIERTYNENNDLFNLNFYAMVVHLCKKMGAFYMLHDPSVLESINHGLNPIIDLCNMYFKDKKYQIINILADNLDTGWDSKNNLSLQAAMILELIEVSETIKNNFSNTKVNLKLFLRKDIYNYILRSAREADKIQLEHYEIDWEKFPEQLKSVLEQRFLYVLNESHKNIEKVWKEYFNFKGIRHPFDIIVEKVVKRPRDIICFVSRLFESAINNNRACVEDEDLIYATNEYTKFLYSNLIGEFKAEFPETEKIFSLLENTYTNILSGKSEVLFTDFYATLQDALVEKDRVDKFINELIDNRYLLGINKNEKITSFELLMCRTMEPKFKLGKIKFSHKYKVYVAFRLMQTIV